MGKKTTKEKLSLMEFLYKDTELISSLYSQVFGGDLLSVSQFAATTEESTLDGGLNIGIAKTKGATKDIVSEQLTKNISSKDEKIIELFSELDIKDCTKSLNNYSNGRIIKLEAGLYFRNLDTFKNIMPLVNQLGFIPTDIFSENDDPEITNQLVNIFMNALPHGLEFELITKQFEKVTCGINEKYLLNDINHISKNYTSKYIGKWTIIGIFDNIISNANNYAHTKDNDFKKGIDDIEESILSSLYSEDNNKFLIKPIIIYRTLTY